MSNHPPVFSLHELHSVLFCLIALCAASACGSRAFAKDIYVAQTTAGSGDGTSVGNALPAIWFNDPQNWGAGTGQINPGDTVHLCGTISTALSVQGSGTAGHVISIFFESGARLSQPAGTLMYCQAKSYVIVDGGSNGIIENTDNGTGMGNQMAASGIYASGCSNFEVKNLLIQNLYVHTSTTDAAVDFGVAGAVYMNGFGNKVSIHDCTFHDICWVLNLGSSPGATGLNIYNNSFYNYDHGVAGVGGTMSSPANINIYHNQFGATASWDTTSNAYHHDGIHIFFAAGGLLSGVNVYDNLFNGDWGSNNTAHIFVEGDYTLANRNAVSNMAIWNNIFIQNPGNRLNNGFLYGNGPDWKVRNNTFLGSGLTNFTAIFLGGTGLIITNNLFTSVTTFISLSAGTTFAAGGLNHNLYAGATPGGNTPWSWGSSYYNAFALWQSATGQDAQSSMVRNANLNADGTLLPGSPAVGAGADLSIYFTTDKNGVTRTPPWDIGALKYVPTTPPAPRNLRVPPAPRNLRVIRN